MDTIRKLEKLEEMLSDDLEIVHGEEAYLFKLLSFDVMGMTVRVTYRYMGEEPLTGQFIHHIESNHAAYLEKVMETYFALPFRAQTIMVIGSYNQGIY
jgi:hypothetical protein